jgi:hypothetical protein
MTDETTESPSDEGTSRLDMFHCVVGRVALECLEFYMDVMD